VRGKDGSVGRDAKALEEFDAAYPRLVLVAYRKVGRFFGHDPSRVEDAVAETMARTFERWERVRRHERPDGWVVVCAKNVCLEHLRTSARQAGAAPLQDVPAPTGDLAERAALSATVWDTLGQLSKRQRDVAVLRYLMDCDEATTAAALGMTVSKVRTAAHEARGRLRTLLDDTNCDADLVTS
jgi:RNA polymerase sigma factor (sigma-70 family)